MNKTSILACFLASALLRVHGEPWATQVVSYTPGTGAAAGYTDPAAALGRPTVDTFADFSAIEPDTVVTPIFPAWTPFDLVSIGTGGSLTVKFDAPILDDSNNLYGVDLLIFGNAFLQEGGGSFPEPGTVSVSQDGTNWFTYSAGPFADDILPTLGRVPDEAGWGAPTDPTRPPDPNLQAADLQGFSLAELAERYRGGAGGTGFDLAEHALSVNSNGLKWCQFVRIVPASSASTEIDAIVDAAPADAWTRWQAAHYAWTNSPLNEAASASPDGDSIRNYDEFAFGLNPTLVETNTPTLRVTPRPDGLSVQLPVSAHEAPWKLYKADTLITPNWVETPAVITIDGTALRYQAIPGSDHGFYRLTLEEPSK